MSKSQRDKGRRGQTMAQHMLEDRDWVCDPISAGYKREDIIATDPNGTKWSVEVKNCASITQAHRAQAIEQANKRKLPWLLMCKIAGTCAWLVQGKDRRPCVWFEKDGGLL